MSSEANVRQRAEAGNAPNIVLTKRTRDVMRKFDYVYWGTPIAGNFFSQLTSAQASSAALTGAFDYMFKFTSGLGGGWQTLTEIETGRGFITRVKQQAPFVEAQDTDFIELTFDGVANNGDIVVPITNNPNSLNGSTSHVLLANPYPSAIDADKFLIENEDIDGVIYIWTAATVNPGSVTLYSQADYIAYTRAGSVIPNEINQIFDGKIASGQGFKVKSLTNNGNVTFNNCMRLVSDNDQFFRVNLMDELNNVVEKDRFKLNLKGENGVFSQILIAYLPEATMNYDRMYDAGVNSVSTTKFYSIHESLEGNVRPLSINARPDFFDTDFVPLGVFKNNTDEASFEISISDLEGIFTTDQVTVYLHDKLLGIYHDLSTGNYSFTMSLNMTNDRFEVVYNYEVLSNEIFDVLDVKALLTHQSLVLSSSVHMKEVKVFDLMGRLIFEEQINNQTSFSTPFVHPQAVYIVKVTTTNDQIVTKKLVNER
jgi:hypothetical protein